MIYGITDGKLFAADTYDLTSTQTQWIFTCTFEEFSKNGHPMCLHEIPSLHNIVLGNSKYESREGYDFLFLTMPRESDLAQRGLTAAVYFTGNILGFICSDCSYVDDLLSKLSKDSVRSFQNSKVLYHFFEKLIGDDSEILDDIEQNITELEETLMTSKSYDCIKDIIALRKTLLTLKRYYEQMLALSSVMQENDNAIIPKGDLRYFKIHTNHVDRLYRNVLNLRDYVTQVREAYQAQVDISLNQIMKLFTVVTVIFMPLTLIVGWYGMNLKMPEFSWHFGYLFVIGLSLCTLLISLMFFKRKKWF